LKQNLHSWIPFFNCRQIELVVDNPYITLAEWALRGHVLKDNDKVNLKEIDPEDEEEIQR
jgi:hypothetical protein